MRPLAIPYTGQCCMAHFNFNWSASGLASISGHYEWPCTFQGEFFAKKSSYQSVPNERTIPVFKVTYFRDQICETGLLLVYRCNGTTNSVYRDLCLTSWFLWRLRRLKNTQLTSLLQNCIPALCKDARVDNLHAIVHGENSIRNLNDLITCGCSHLSW